jgi:PAS domain S-box-containing protein
MPMKTIASAEPRTDGYDSSGAMEELPVAYVEMDAHGVITRANRLTRLAHSTHAGELIGKPAWELMPLEEQELSRAAFRKAMESGEDPPVARRSIYNSTDRYTVYDIHRNLIRDAEGHPAGMRVVSVDVSASHNALQVAKTALDWLESIFCAMTDAVIATDALGLVRTANRAAEELLGWKEAELSGQEIEKVFSLLSFDEGGEPQLDFTQEIDSHSRRTATLLDRERRELRVEIKSAPILDKSNGSMIGAVSVLRRMNES